MTTQERIKKIQTRLGLKDDGIIGPATLTAIERLLDKEAPQPSSLPGMTCSKTGLRSIITFEISSDAFYNRHLKNPIWPGGESGITIGVGYDLGYVSVVKMWRDWGGKISDTHVSSLEKVCGLKGENAHAQVNQVSIRAVNISLESASQVFYLSSLPVYAAKCLDAYPGVEKLPADAQAALLSLVFNRGTRKSGSTRREMKALETLIANADLDGIATEILKMKRLWEGKGLDGLLRRREHEAALVKGARREYDPEELVQI